MRVSGSEIKRRREALGLSQTKLAAAIDMTTAAVKSWESERTEPHGGTLVALARALDCTVEDLVVESAAS